MTAYDTINTDNKTHRTAVTVFTPRNATDEYVERIEGLVGSLNRTPNFSEGGTIKVDVYSVDESGNVSRGLNWPGNTIVDGAAAMAQAVQAAKDAGYALVVPAVPGA